MTYGEEAVGLNFNPSGDPAVQKIKELYAGIIDLLYSEMPREFGVDRSRIFSNAITEAQTAQMWAVKALTWKD